MMLLKTALFSRRTLNKLLPAALVALTGFWGCAGQPVSQHERRSAQQPRPFVSPAKPAEPGTARFSSEQEEIVEHAEPVTPENDPAKDLVSSGRYLDAALLLIELANRLPPPQRQDQQLRVTTLLLQGNYIVQADQVLRETDVTGLGRKFHIQKTMLNAQLTLARQLPDDALTQLTSLQDDISQASIELQTEYYHILIDIHSTLGDYISAATIRASLNPLLDDQEEILENQETLLRDLQYLSPSDLKDLESSSSDITMKGWAGLAYAAMSARDESHAQELIDDWTSTYPGHNVASSIVDTVLAQHPEALGRATQVALILPMSGRFAKAATAIRDGFLAAYYEQTGDVHRPQIKMYDEGTDPQDIQTIYQKAIDDGADFVVGPLSKKAVSNLAATEIQGGLLSLNYGESDNTSDASNFFQLSLSPEQEAVHVAEHAWLDGHTQAAAIVPDSGWGSRVFEAFKARWEELGGSIVGHQTYNMRKNDYSAPIKQLLNINQSEKRYNKLRSLLKEKIDFEPRRRKDVDFIFMAAFSRQGRLLRPQLKFHRASNIPVYATSHVFSGSLEPQMDRDMNGVRFSDMPWTLSSDTPWSKLKQKIESTFPNSSKRYMRLYALGIDAYNIIPELNRLRRNRFSSYQGETGTLYLDIANRLQRKLLWAQFKSGKPKIIQEF